MLCSPSNMLLVADEAPDKPLPTSVLAAGTENCRVCDAVLHVKSAIPAVHRLLVRGMPAAWRQRLTQPTAAREYGAYMAQVTARASMGLNARHRDDDARLQASARAEHAN